MHWPEGCCGLERLALVGGPRPGREAPPRELLGVIRGLSCRPVSMMHQQAASSHYSAAQGGAQHYQGQSMAMMGQSGQGSGMIGQRPMAPYRPSQQGKARPQCLCLRGNRWGVAQSPGL